MSTDRKANAPGRTGPIAHELGKIRVGRLPTMNQDEYPGLSGWWVQLRIGEDGEEVLARVYGNTPEQAHSRATALAGQPGQALTQQTLDDVMAGIPARDAEIAALRKEIESFRAAQAQPETTAERFIQAAIDRAPEPLRRLGNWLTTVLDEDQWAHAERLLLRAAQNQPVSGADGLDEREAFEKWQVLKNGYGEVDLKRGENGEYSRTAISDDWHVWQSRAALAQKESNTGKTVSVENQGVTKQDADKVQADLLSSLVEIVDAVIANDEEGLIEHSETIVKARAAIDAARKERA